MSIPKIIHYCWFGKGEIPERDQKCIESWKKYCPDYKVILWNEDNYDVLQIPYTKEAYEAGRWAFVSDFARIDLVCRYGGIYMDTDVELLRPLDGLLEYRGYAGIESDSNCVSFGLGFGAEPGHPLLQELRDHYGTLHFKNGDATLNLTPNPIIVTEYLKHKGYRIVPGVISTIEELTVFPDEYFCPQVFSTGKTKVTKNTYSIHHYHASWQTECEKKALQEYRRYTRIFGETAGDLLYQVHKTIKNDGLRAMVKKTISHIKRKL